MDIDATLELYQLVKQILIRNNLGNPKFFSVLFMAIMVSKKHIVIHFFKGLIEAMERLYKEGELEVTDDEWKRMRELFDRIAKS